MPPRTRKRARDALPIGCEFTGIKLSELSLPDAATSSSTAFRKGVETAVPAKLASSLRSSLKRDGLLLLRDQPPSERIATEILALSLIHI